MSGTKERSTGGTEARYYDGELDEVVADNVGFHLEQLDDGVWWIGLDHPDGTVDHITLSTKRGAKIAGRFEADA